VGIEREQRLAQRDAERRRQVGRPAGAVQQVQPLERRLHHHLAAGRADRLADREPQPRRVVALADERLAAIGERELGDAAREIGRGPDQRQRRQVRGALDAELPQAGAEAIARLRRGARVGLRHRDHAIQRHRAYRRGTRLWPRAQGENTQRHEGAASTVNHIVDAIARATRVVIANRSQHAEMR
jgi:hypothetical protein